MELPVVGGAPAPPDPPLHLPLHRKIFDVNHLLSVILQTRKIRLADASLF
jgi:hypothetical protein